MRRPQSRGRALGAALAIGFAATAAGVSAGTGAPPPATRVVDRTFECTTDLQAGVRKLYLAAQAGFKETRTRWKWLPSTIVTTGGVERPGPDSTAIAGISAGPSDALGRARIWVGSGRCRASKGVVLLTSSGLRTQPAGVLGDTYDCRPPARLLLRVRAVFKARTTLELNGSYGQFRAQGNVESAELALRTPAGAPFAYATVNRRGTTRLWSVAGCRDS